MKKFENVFLLSDVDNTLVNTSYPRKNNLPIPRISERNIQAIQYFIEQGGTFTAATGRSITFFEEYARQVPMNAPCVLFNGAAIYDYRTHEYLETLMMPENTMEHVKEIYQHFPTIAVEIFDKENVYLFQPNQYSVEHHRITNAPVQEVMSINDLPVSMLKVIFDETHEVLCAVKDWILSQDWASEMEVVFSDQTLLELIPKGTDKGTMVKRLAEILKLSPDHIYCAGDADNDVSMLTFAKEGFAPANCFPSVRECGATIVADSDHDAIAEIIEILDARYS